MASEHGAGYRLPKHALQLPQDQIDNYKIPRNCIKQTKHASEEGG